MWIVVFTMYADIILVRDKPVEYVPRVVFDMLEDCNHYATMVEEYFASKERRDATSVSCEEVLINPDRSY